MAGCPFLARSLREKWGLSPAQYVNPASGETTAPSGVTRCSAGEGVAICPPDASVPPQLPTAGFRSLNPNDCTPEGCIASGSIFPTPIVLSCPTRKSFPPPYRTPPEPNSPRVPHFSRVLCARSGVFDLRHARTKLSSASDKSQPPPHSPPSGCIPPPRSSF